ncbi:MAG: lysoplasmalogenase [Deltaproteobacteria bacterium]|nr:lysoplasmalogenase [Deltaproteobacteria bacterium]
MFLPGLIFFLTGHVFYVIAFFNLSSLNSGTLMGAMIFILISGGVYIRLMPYLGSMKRSVLAYVVIITFMVSGASTVLGDSLQPLNARLLVFSGALFFYLSDVFVARNRFIKKEAFNRIVGLPLYYAGQFLLAFSIGFVQ